MIGDIAKWASKFMFYLVFWVLILSVRWEGRTLFDRAHEIIVENPLVELIDEELHDVWIRISDTAESTYAELKARRERESGPVR